MRLEASAIQSNGDITALVFDGHVIHYFSVLGGLVVYEVSKPGGELVARPAAELQQLDMDDRLLRLVIRTQSHVFEIVPLPGDVNGRWIAYKQLNTKRLIMESRI
jgi:hypothetical protein